MKKKVILFLVGLMFLSGCRTNGRQIGPNFDINVYKDYMTEDNKVDSLNYLMTNDEKDLSLLGRLRLRYDILRLHNILHHRNRINRRLKYLTNLVRKDLG